MARRFALLLVLLMAGCPSPSELDGGATIDAPADANPADANPTDANSADASALDASPPDAPVEVDAADAGDCEPREICGNGIDDDCNGATDEAVDTDGDGWTTCDGDCCDAEGDCPAPMLVNPGAYDWVGDGVDDDCSGVVDDPATACDSGIASDEVDPLRYGGSLGLCATTSESPPLAERRWGLISAGFTLASGAGTPAVESRAVRPAFGAIVPRDGASMTVLSTGHAAAPGQVAPVYSTFVSTNMGTESGVPARWRAAHGGTIPTAPSCAAPLNPTAYDSTLLRLRIRVPTNARALALDTFFLASEFPEWVCGAFSDYAVVLLQSAATTNPADGNLAQSIGASGAIPLGSSVGAGNSGLFTACRNGITGCADASVMAGTISTCTGTALLAGTGFDLPDSGQCDEGSLLGGGTGWLTVQGNVLPGETIEISLAIWDSSDANSDSVALFDALRWLPAPVTPGMHP